MKPMGISVRSTTPAKANRQELGQGVLLAVGGGIALTGLFTLTHFVRLDSLLVASQAIYNVISGVNGIAQGIGRLLLGLAQMVGFAALSVVAVIAVLAVASGSIRIGLNLLPQLESTWNLLAHGLNGLTQLVCLPQRRQAGPGRLKQDPRHQRPGSPKVSRSSASIQRVA